MMNPLYHVNPYHYIRTIILNDSLSLHCSSYQMLVQWVDSGSKTQDDPIMSELNAVQNQLEAHKVYNYLNKTFKPSGNGLCITHRLQ